MSKLHRYYQPGQSCFVTSVTANREPILVDHSDLLFRAMCRAVRKTRILIVAWVILPDHFHILVDACNGRVDKFVHLVKLSFVYQFKIRCGKHVPIWQHRYWDHIVRSEQDLNNHIDYIHFNPVKHGLCNCPSEWRHSSLGRFKRRGQYEPDWGSVVRNTTGSSFGE